MFVVDGSTVSNALITGKRETQFRCTLFEYNLNIIGDAGSRQGIRRGAVSRKSRKMKSAGVDREFLPHYGRKKGIFVHSKCTI